MKFNMTDWIPQMEDNLKCECDIESLPPPIPPKIIDTLPSYQNVNNDQSGTVVMKSELNSAPTLPPKPAPRPPGN